MSIQSTLHTHSRDEKKREEREKSEARKRGFHLIFPAITHLLYLPQTDITESSCSFLYTVSTGGVDWRTSQ